MSLDRRALLAAALAGMAGLRGARAAGSPRIVCLEWTAAELVLTLGIVPVALADVAGYREWVAAPALPASVLDLGSRGEPNKELVARLKPDLIVATARLRHRGRRLRLLRPGVRARILHRRTRRRWSRAGPSCCASAERLGRLEEARRAIAAAGRGHRCSGAADGAARRAAASAR